MYFLFKVEVNKYLLGAGILVFFKLFIRNEPKVLLYLPLVKLFPLSNDIEEELI